jgi:hypothetical protein
VRGAESADVGSGAAGAGPAHMRISVEVRNDLEAGRVEARHALQRVGHVSEGDFAGDQPRLGATSGAPRSRGSAGPTRLARI